MKHLFYFSIFLGTLTPIFFASATVPVEAHGKFGWSAAATSLVGTTDPSTCPTGSMQEEFQIVDITTMSQVPVAEVGLTAFNFTTLATVDLVIGTGPTIGPICYNPATDGIAISIDGGSAYHNFEMARVWTPSPNIPINKHTQSTVYLVPKTVVVPADYVHVSPVNISTSTNPQYTVDVERVPALFGATGLRSVYFFLSKFNITSGAFENVLTKSVPLSGGVGIKTIPAQTMPGDGWYRWSYYLFLNGTNTSVPGSTIIDQPTSGWAGFDWPFLYDTTPPVQSVTHTPSPVYETNQVQILGEASDALAGINKMVLYLDGLPVKTCSFASTQTAECQTNAGSFSVGTTHSYFLVSTDGVGLISTSTINTFKVLATPLSNCVGDVWTSRTSAADNLWTDVTYGNGLFVAVAASGAGNRVMTSPDGITWTSRTSAADNNWQSITYGNGLFVAVSNSGSGNRVMTSPDGITWTGRVSSPTDAWWSGVTYGNGLFVAVSHAGTGNRVMTSPDGITWTGRVSPAVAWWSAITYGNGLFVAVSRNSGPGGNWVMTSPDGITWTSTMLAFAAGNHWQSITYGNGLFVAVSSDGAGNRVMTSPDGITWTGRVSSPTDAWWTGVTYGNGLFVAVSWGSNRVMTSPDGITWTSYTAAVNNNWNSVTYGNGLFAAVSDTGTGNRVMTSACTARPNIVASSHSPADGYSVVDSVPSILFSGTVRNSGTSSDVEGGWADLEIDWNSDGNTSDPSKPFDENHNAFSGSKLGTFAFDEQKTISYELLNPPVGTHRYRFTADVVNELAESNESDNSSAWRTFTVVSDPNQCTGGSAPSFAQACSATPPSGSAPYMIVDRCSDWTNPSMCIYECSPGYIQNGTGTCVLTQCNDGIDNLDTEDVLIDMADPGCTSINDNDESDSSPVLSAVSRVVNEGDPITISWDTNNGNESLCTLVGPGITGNPLTPSTGNPETGNFTVNIFGLSAYTLTCGLQSTKLNIELAPKGWDS